MIGEMDRLICPGEIQIVKKMGVRSSEGELVEIIVVVDLVRNDRKSFEIS